MAAPIVGDRSEAASTRPLLEVTGVTKRFGGVRALDDVSLRVMRGSVAALIGPNGAGKSSLFNVVTGVAKPDAGQVMLGGQDITGKSVAEVARAGIARTFQTARGFSSMSAIENLLMVSPAGRETLLGALAPTKSRSQDDENKALAVLRRLGLERLAESPYDQLSSGQMRLLEIGRHLMRDIELVLLDEPTAGVVPVMQEHLAEAVRDLARAGITVLIVEHNLKFVFSLASTVSVMVGGRVISEGSPATIQQDRAVIAAYLGGGERQ